MAENRRGEDESDKGLRLLTGIVLAAVATFFLLYFLGFTGQPGRSLEMKVESQSVERAAAGGS